MNYVDGYILAVPTKNKQAYLEVAETMAPIFKDHGALNVAECWGDDVPEGKLTSFPMAVQCKEDETVVFSWIIWPNKEVRDKGLHAAMEDSRMQAFKDMPFDGKRMIFGGFQQIVNA